MSGFICRFCNQVMSLDRSTYTSRISNFSFADYSEARTLVSSRDFDDTVSLDFYKCPNCKEISIILKGVGEKTKNIFIPVYPRSLAKQFPEYVPVAIRKDYEEAYAIVNISPKASATLSRRCLQGMIRDFWNIKMPRLVDEINALKDLVPPSQWKVIDGVRRIGNIGAHMEKDVNLIIDIDPSEATKLLKLIERLVESWYVERHNEESLYEDIVAIDESKKSLKQAKE